MQYDLKYQVVISDVKLQINPLMFVSGWKWLRGIKMAPFLFLLCCEKKSVSMKKKPDEKIKKQISEMSIQILFLLHDCSKVRHFLLVITF